MKAIKIITGIILVLALAGLLIGVYIKGRYETAIETENSDSTEIAKITVDTGESLDSITQKLIDSGVLKEEYRQYFTYYVKLNKLYPKFQAGSFNIPKDLNIKELTKTLEEGKIDAIWVTIPEGLRRDEIAEILEAEFSKHEGSNFSELEFLELTEDASFIKFLGITVEDLPNLEGFLFPDRYQFEKDVTAKDVITLMVETFKTKAGVGYTYEDIIIASMLEREGRSDEDRRMIADIINRRMEEGWLLNIDATLLYPKKDWKHELTIQDLEEDNEYNTYTRTGLPPTPICNPGESSIKAALDPKPNQYYYYIHEDNGTAHYGETLDDHNANIRKYLQK